MTNQDGPVLTPSILPNAADFDVKDSSFFRKWPELPSPEDVRSKAESQYLAGVNHDTRRNPKLTPPFVRPPLVVFKDMGLLVKWGSGVGLNEGLTLYAIRLLLEGAVPVPEVYGWRTEGSERYIYVEYMHGQTLEHAWEGINSDDRKSICAELQSIIKHLRRLNQDPLDPFVGSITRGSLYDRTLHPSYVSEAGPFTTVREFHDWFTFLCRRPMPDPYSVPIEPFRYELPDGCGINFTHGDLHRSSIIISAQKPYRVLAIVDWEQAGWLPEYWEARKALYSIYRSEEWAMTYLPLVMELYSNTWEAWDWYTTSMGC